MAELKKLVRGVSTAGDVFDDVNRLIDYGYEAHKQKFLDSLNSGEEFNYIVTGDSTRNNGFSLMMQYYTNQLSKVGWVLSNNSESGLKTEQWVDNTRNASLNAAVSLTPNTGKNTILEFSLGINDVGTTAEKKANLLLAITSYLSQRPDATVILVSPLGSIVGRTELTSIYSEISSELELKMIDGSKIMNSVINNSDFMADGTHPNQFGSMRVVNAIFNYLLPASLKNAMYMQDDGYPTPPDVNLNPFLQGGYWSVSNGTYLNNSSQLESNRSFEKIPVEPNFLLKVDHGGNMFHCIFYDANGDFLSWTQTTQVNGNEREILIPNGAYFVSLNITTSATSWEALSYPFVVEYKIQESNYLTQLELNQGLVITLPYLQNTHIDSSGKYPEVGQSPVGGPDGKWYWT